MHINFWFDRRTAHDFRYSVFSIVFYRPHNTHVNRRIGTKNKKRSKERERKSEKSISKDWKLPNKKKHTLTWYIGVHMKRTRKHNYCIFSSLFGDGNVERKEWRKKQPERYRYVLRVLVTVSRSHTTILRIKRNKNSRKQVNIFSYCACPW